jgi:diaminopimelate decarboxylase
VTSPAGLPPSLAYGTDGRLHVEAVPVDEIAVRFGTPTYVYSRAALESTYAEFRDACAGRDALVCYAVKANANLAILNLFARLGAGFDIVSGGELARVIAAGAAPRKVVFSGVGKTADEMRQALHADILCFNVESK